MGRRVACSGAGVLLAGLLWAGVAGAQVKPESRHIVAFREPGGGRAAVAALGGRVVLELPPQSAVAVLLPEAAAEALRRHPAIEYVEPDPIREPYAQTRPYGIDMVQAPLVWPYADGAGRKICVIDSGLYTSHEDLQRSGITGYPSTWSTDRCGHGTHVTGTLAALDNTLGVVGVLPKGISLHVIKVFGDNCGWTYASTLVDALNRCVSAGSHVVNMSLGGTSSSTTERNAFQSAWNAGVLSVAAAGNAGNSTFSYPASYDSVISVAAVDASKELASFSQRNSQVELAAPGVSVLSTVSWRDEVSVSVSGVTYAALHLENAARTAGVTGTLVDGGLCTSAGAWSGRVVLCERGSISFYDKVRNVQAGGGIAAVIFNNVSGNFSGTLGSGNSSAIPAVSLSREDGLFLQGNRLGASATVVSLSENPGSGYEAWNGTSMATPHVAAVAALVWSRNTAWTNTQIREALRATAEDRGATGRDNSFGYGIVRARAALDWLLAGTAPNQPPSASFTYECSGLSCVFADTSSDSDGSVIGWSWEFGDGATSTTRHPSHTYAAGGTYEVRLTATDDDEAVGVATRQVQVSTESAPPIDLSAVGYKVKGQHRVDLRWSGATSSQIDVFRNGARVARVANTGSYTDAINARGSATYVYRVCEAGSTVCSAERTVVF